MKKIQTVQTPYAPAAIGPYSQAIIFGELVFCSGQIPLNPETKTLVPGDVTEQVTQVLKNVQNVLEAAGSDLGQVLKTTIFLSDMKDFEKVNEVYARFFKEPYPARSTVEVSQLPRSAKVEIEVIAALKISS